MKKVVERLEQRVNSLAENLAQVKKQVEKLSKEDKEKLSKDVSLIKEEISEQLEELKKDIDTNADDIKKLEELAKKLDGFSQELASLKDEVLSENKEESDKNKEGTPSLFASVFYGGLIANTLGKIPMIGDSISSWAKKKVEDSKKEETAGEEKKSGFFKKVWNTVFWSGIATAGVWLGRKLIPDEWMKEIKSWLPWTDEAKAKKQPKEQAKDAPQKDQTDIKKDPNVTASDGSSQGEQNQETIQNPTSESVENDEKPKDDQEANQQVERMYSEGYSEGYILMKMYQLGFVPEGFSGNSRFRFVKILQGQPLEWAGKLSREMKARLMQSFGKSRDITLQLKLDAISNANSDLVKNFDTKYNRLTSIIDDFGKGKLSSLEELNKNYPELVKEFGEKRFIETEKAYLEKLKIKSEHEFDRMKVIESDVIKSDADLKQLKSQAQTKLQELDTQAKTADASTKKRLQTEANKIVEEYNLKALEIEKTVGTKMTCLDAVEVQKLSKVGVVDGLLKFNGNIDGFLKGKASGRLLLGAGLFTLATDYATGVKSGSQFGLEVADIGVGMLPFGGAYDIYTSITGKGIAGNLSTTDRWIRGAVGGLTLVLDVAGFFTFGGGNVASLEVKSLAKGGSWLLKSGKVVGKSVEATKSIGKGAEVAKVIVKGAEGAMTGVKVLGLGYLGYSVVTATVPIAYDFTKGQIEKFDKKLTPDIKVN